MSLGQDKEKNKLKAMLQYLKRQQVHKLSNWIIMQEMICSIPNKLRPQQMASILKMTFLV